MALKFDATESAPRLDVPTVAPADVGEREAAMTRYRVLVMIAMVGCAALGVVPAQGATRANFAKKCSDAWAGSRATAA